MIRRLTIVCLSTLTIALGACTNNNTDVTARYGAVDDATASDAGAGSSPAPYTSCEAILAAGASTGTGTYTIDVDGAGPKPPFSVKCDMETNGGGWNCVNPQNALGPLVAALEGANISTGSRGSAGFMAKGQPYADLESGEVDYSYSFDWPPGFTEFYLDNFTVLGVQTIPNAPTPLVIGGTCTGGPDCEVADVDFGNANSNYPTTAFSQLGTFVSDGYPIAWPAGSAIFESSITINPIATQFEMDFDATGTNISIIPWNSGNVCMRKSTAP